MGDLNTIYLSGKMTGLSKNDMNSWREKMVAALKKEVYADIINPVEYYNTESVDYDTDKEYIKWELRQAQNCSVLIVGWNIKQDSLGTMAELTSAYLNNVPIIVYLYDTTLDDDDPYGIVYENLHPFVKYMSDKIFYADEISKLATYIRKYIFFERYPAVIEF